MYVMLGISMVHYSRYYFDIIQQITGIRTKNNYIMYKKYLFLNNLYLSQVRVQNTLLLATGCTKKNFDLFLLVPTLVAKLTSHPHSHYALDHSYPPDHCACYHIHSTLGHSAHYHACNYQEKFQSLKP